MSRITTDELAARIPPDEDRNWEFKAAILLQDKTKLKHEISKQVSAFANSGGGHILIGFNEDTNSFEPCEELHGRQSMKDYLSTLVETSVAFEIRAYSVERIAFTGDASKAVFLITVEDSPAAPHQAFDKFYYYRIDGHSKPAPHFHLDLLRRRETKALLEIIAVQEQIQSFNDNTLMVGFHVTVKNCSFQCATNWGVMFRTSPADVRWTTNNKMLRDWYCWPVRSQLLPNETGVVTLQAFGRPMPGMDPRTATRMMWEQLGFTFCPVSQNAVGREYHFGWRDNVAESIRQGQRLEREFK